MAKLQFGTYDLFQWNAIEAMPEPVDFYDQHLSEVQLAEQVGFDYHFIIEHQGNNIGQCSAPLVYLSALAQRTSTIRFGAMIFQLPFYNPPSAWPKTQPCWTSFPGDAWSLAQASASWNTNLSGGTCLSTSEEKSPKRLWK